MSVNVNGRCDPGFESLKSEFEKSFENGTNLGATLAVYYKNQLVVDLAGGFQDSAKTKAYTHDTVNVVHSSGKFVEGLAVLQAISNGLIDFDTKIASVWPGFGAGGKQDVTVKDVLEHAGGVTYVEGEHVPLPAELSDLDALAKRIEGQPHNFGGVWTKAYHAITRGWFLSEVLRRVRPDHKSFGSILTTEICPQLGISIYCGLPDSVKSSSNFCHVVYSPEYEAQMKAMGSLPPPGPTTPPGAKMLLPLSKLDDIDASKGTFWSHSSAFLKGETPSASCVTNARALAKLANVLTNTNHGSPLLSEKVWQLGITREQRNKDVPDAALGVPVATTWGGFGYNRPNTLSRQVLMDWSQSPPAPYLPDWQIGEGWNWVGWGGAGGSIVCAAPERDVAFAFVPNWMIRGIQGDERGARLMCEVTRCIDRIEGRA